MKKFTLFFALLATALFAVDHFDIVDKPNGTIFGRTTTQKCAFHGATPVAQRSGSAQAAVTDTVGAALATTAATQTTPYGFSQAQADGLISRVNALIVDNAAKTVLINELRASLVEKGIIAGQ